MEKVIQSTQPNSISIDISPLVKGYIAMAIVLLIWSGFALTVRAIGSSPLSIADVSLIRFFVPLVCLALFIPSHWKSIRTARLSDMTLILLGGIPFLFLASLGAKTSPTAYVGTILAGTPPFFVALLSYLCYRHKLSLKILISMSLILLGIAVMVMQGSESILSEMASGVLYLLAAAVVWSGYIMGLKRAGLNSISVAIILSYLSFFITMGLILFNVVPSNIGTFSFNEALPFVLVQGLGVGVIATIGFSYAVTHLGSSKSSIIGSISPGLTALLAVVIFEEPLTIAILCGIGLTITGVILSSRS